MERNVISLAEERRKEEKDMTDQGRIEGNKARRTEVA